MGWREFQRQACGQRLSCYVEDEDATSIATNTWSQRPLHEWLGEVNAAFGHRNVARLALDPQAGTLTITLRRWQPSWGYYPTSPPWHAAQLAAEHGGAAFPSWRGQ